MTVIYYYCGRCGKEMNSTWIKTTKGFLCPNCLEKTVIKEVKRDKPT